MLQEWNRSLGAVLLDPSTCRFRVWAPQARSVAVHIFSPVDQLIAMHHEGAGYWSVTVPDAGPGTTYKYRINDDKERPDPASQAQPDGVHGASQVVDQQFDWQHTHWPVPTLSQYVIYELHIGTFTPAGTFDAAIEQLDDLVALGVTVIEMMPVAQFPGERNWGYDGVYLYAPHPAYGGVQGLKRFVDACHERGLAVMLDVVYNHLGAEGNYLWDYGPYFTERYHTPWGAAVNLDGPESDHVRRFFIENICMWIVEFKIDGFRLDAVHALLDFSAFHFLEELTTTVHTLAEQLQRRVYVIAESDQNDPRLMRPAAASGFGLDAQWSDDFHHALHTLLTGQADGYYADFVRADGSVPVEYLVRALREGFAYTGQYSAIRRRKHGRSSWEFPAEQFVVCIQNHDQVGNRMLGERFSQLLSHEQRKLAAALLLLGPYTPLLFMGEEYADPAPFLYFIDHGDPELVEAVRNGRKTEFAMFAWQGEPPDPQDAATFERSKLNHALRTEGEHGLLLQWYTTLLRMRRTNAALQHGTKQTQTIQGWEAPRIVMVERWHEAEHVWIAAYFDAQPLEIALPLPPGRWQVALDSAAVEWDGPGSSLAAEYSSTGLCTLALAPYSCIVLVKKNDRINA